MLIAVLSAIYGAFVFKRMIDDDELQQKLDEVRKATIRQPIRQMVAASTRVLLESIDGKLNEPEHLSLAGRLVERGSARKIS